MLITASSYPFLNILWTTLIFFAWVIFIWIAITVLIDVFRRSDIGGWGKAGWVIFVVVLPWLGVLVYLIANHDGMAERKIKDAQAQQAQIDEYVRKTAGSGGAASEIAHAKELLDNGTLTQAEFDAIKAKALA
ncbi:MAG: SHOCT domain-containing protein [Solirubrobacteraceae bacterium]